MIEQLSERDQRLVLKSLSAPPASFRFRKNLGFVLLFLAVASLGCMAYVVALGPSYKGVYSFPFLTILLFMAADIVGERARLRWIIHCLAKKCENEGVAEPAHATDADEPRR